MTGLFNFFDTEEDKKETTEDAGKLQLRKEELDIKKNRVKTGEVELSKEIVEEQKTVDVPVTREEVVIERRSLNNEATDSPISDEETIHIPVSEEQVDVDKHTVITGEVSAHKREVEETKRIDESLKREEARLRTSGDVDIVDDDSDNSLR
jgi:uncharacterized protein (TIGR02271 family)